MVIDEDLVKRLVATQFPSWGSLAVIPVQPNGWDNRTFRLGNQLSVRMPSAEAYAAQVDKEQRWLPVLASQLPLRIPEPVARGQAGEGFPWPWSIYRWIEGEVAASAATLDRVDIAVAVAHFLTALQAVDAAGGPAPGAHNFYRGGPLSVYDSETRRALSILADTIDVRAAQDVWESALSATFRGAPVWFHGDVSRGNLLLANGDLTAVIDFGTCGVGDPACDLTIAWTSFTDGSRDAFRRGLALDDATWARARGWTIWKALIVAAGLACSNSVNSAKSSRRVLAEVIADHRRSKSAKLDS